MLSHRRNKLEGVVDDPFTRRKTRPKFSNTTKEEPEMTSELLMKLEQERVQDIEEKQLDDFEIEIQIKPKSKE